MLIHDTTVDPERRSLKRLRSSNSSFDDLLSVDERMMFLTCKPDQVGKTRQVVYIISHQEDIDQWDIGMVVPYDEIDESMAKKPKAKQVLVRMFEDERYELAHSNHLTPFDKKESPYKLLMIKYPYYENKKMVRCALRYLETGQVNSSFKWPKWLAGEEGARITATKNEDNSTISRGSLVEHHVGNDDDDNKNNSTISIEGKETFDRRWTALMKETGLNEIENLNVGRMEVEMYQLYCSVIKRGGMDYVTRHQLWGEIYEDLSSSTFSTNYPSFLKKYYKKYLFHYEQRYVANPLPDSKEMLVETSDKEPFRYSVDDRAIASYKATKEKYMVKILNREFRRENGKRMAYYMVHFFGWKSRFDEWIPENQLTPSEDSQKGTKSSSISPPSLKKPMNSTIKSSHLRRVSSDSPIRSSNNFGPGVSSSKSPTSSSLSVDKDSTLVTQPTLRYSSRYDVPTAANSPNSHNVKSHSMRRSSLNSSPETIVRSDSSSVTPVNPEKSEKNLKIPISRSPTIELNSELPVSKAIVSSTSLDSSNTTQSKSRNSRRRLTASDSIDLTSSTTSKGIPSINSKAESMISDSNSQKPSLGNKTSNQNTQNPPRNDFGGKVDKPSGTNAKFYSHSGSLSRRHQQTQNEARKEFQTLLSDYAPLESFDGMSIMEMEYRLRYLHERYHLLAEEVERVNRQLSRRFPIKSQN